MKKIIFIALLVLVNLSLFAQEQQQPTITLRQVFNGKDSILMNQTFAAEIMPLLQTVDTINVSPKLISTKRYVMGNTLTDSTLAAMYPMGGITVQDFGVLFYNFRHGSLGDLPVYGSGNVMFLQCKTAQYEGEYIINLMYAPKYGHWVLEAFHYDHIVKMVFAKGVQVVSTL